MVEHGGEGANGAGIEAPVVGWDTGMEADQATVGATRTDVEASTVAEDGVEMAGEGRQRSATEMESGGGGVHSAVVAAPMASLAAEAEAGWTAELEPQQRGGTGALMEDGVEMEMEGRQCSAQVLEDGGDDVHIAVCTAPVVEEVAATEPGRREVEAVTGRSADESSASGDATASTMARVTRCVDRPTQVFLVNVRTTGPHTQTRHTRKVHTQTAQGPQTPEHAGTRTTRHSSPQAQALTRAAEGALAPPRAPWRAGRAGVGCSGGRRRT